MDKISKKVTAKTGLKTKAGIDAYHTFCSHAGLEDGVLMYGSIRGELGKRKYDYWYKKFVKMGLISKFKNVRQATTKYPVLLGYNFMNDREFYIPYKRKGGKYWNGRITVDWKEQIEKLKKQGYVFRRRFL